MPQPRYYHFGKVEEDGRLRLEHKDRFTAALRRLAGKEVQLTLERRTNDRTLNQNAAYWALIVKPLAQEFGYADPDEMHEILKAKFLRKWAKGKLGTFPYARSTTKLSTIQFEEYCEQIRTWAQADHGIRLVLPNEVEIQEEF